MAKPAPRPLAVHFFRTESGNEPVREWLKDLTDDEKKTIGADILTVQWAWPVGKPLVDSMGKGLWEVRSSLGDRIARVFFIMVDEKMILLHGIIKKSRTAPVQELKLARKRQSIYVQPIEQTNESKSTRKRPPRK
ncbi:type II toxin-antitoxin system RelE/ParE family toxin [Haloferula chungangensis]|uniref:Type II toxin-antitoxin system RelE/ParE family toxin n=1 Tax=Haloferula chungangensis TaxID=1048331 RepID=A0ABW2LEU6_9BACT